MATVYKVVSRDENGQLWSAATVDERWKVRYPVGALIVARQPDSMLYAFRDYDSAARFMRAWCGRTHEMWEAEADIDQSVEMPWCATVGFMFDLFWQNMSKVPSRYVAHAPDGTVLCKSITLRKKVGVLGLGTVIRVNEQEEK